MAWLMERYRRLFGLLGYNYPPYFLLIADVGQFLFCSIALGQRVATGVSGWQVVVVAAAFLVGTTPSSVPLFRLHRPLLPLLPVYYIGAVALFWTIPVHGDVAPLILVLGATMAATVTPFRQSAVYVAAFMAAAVAGVVVGAVDQGWLLTLMVGFGGCTGQLLQSQFQAMEATSREHERQQLVDRAGIAGEVHDVVAHSLSIVLLNVTAARRALESGRGPGGAVDATDAGEAIEALRDAEKQGREAMGDVRRTIELLRSDGSPDSAAPGLSDIDGLVAGFHRAGSEVSLAFAPPGEKLSSATELAIYRVVQESLSNASRHAPGMPVSVEVGPRDHAGFGVRVANPVPAGFRPSRTGSGLGLGGMTSRVENLDGEFRAGVEERQWVVDARFGRGGPVTDESCWIGETINGR